MSLFRPRRFADGDRLEVAGARRDPEGQPPRAPACRCGSTARAREIVATAPSPRRLAEAAAFARERAGWIAERMAELPDADADPARA